ncbi:lipase family protein [Candidatus Mycobacterium wuenschmannii]|uniref:Lipase family protein n=1 Tax=Candidatus Mycobacterium wuenschmannii TaxID=3027808 RepID=A0ABY8VVC6_9MYCO|nr:lipase family protein [Candidatus Mycobacterium wuenschmannii]WIM87467.1 lipase family protein [Candidatus Mycobacterium wuenschmannii]
MTTPSFPVWNPGRNSVPGRAVELPQPHNDSFYSYTGSAPLESIAPGTVVDARHFHYHLFGFPTLLETTQLLYRSTSQTGKPTVNVTSIIRPPFHFGAPRVLSFQSAYDSLNRNDQPSYAIWGGFHLGGVITHVEAVVFGPFLAEGYTIIVPDTEGQRADFAAGPEYGKNTLDSIRAAVNSSAVPGDAKVAMLGYSGGAIATEWAAELAPTYAPEVNERLIGAAMGGVLVDPAHNLHYVEGAGFWAGVMAMALVGISRAFEVEAELATYLTPNGTRIFNAMQTASIVDVLGQYDGLTWSDLVVPEYPTPEQVPVYVRCANQLIMGTGGTPTIPLFIGQGAHGELEGTPSDQPGIGAGDGVMIAGDVRTLARDYCARGVTVHYEEYAELSHIWSLPIWLHHATRWTKQRFAGLPATQNCSSIREGNILAPIPVPPTPTSAV